MQDFRLNVNKFDSLLTETTGIKYELSVSGKHNADVDFKSTYEGIDVLLKINKSSFLNDNDSVKWKYCADPSSNYWVTRNSTDLVSLTVDFHQILKQKMFDKNYLDTLKKETK